MEKVKVTEDNYIDQMGNFIPVITKNTLFGEMVHCEVYFRDTCPHCFGRKFFGLACHFLPECGKGYWLPVQRVQTLSDFDFEDTQFN